LRRLGLAAIVSQSISFERGSCTLV